MNKQLRLWCTLLLLAAFGTMWAGEETITFSQKDYNNGQSVPTVAGVNFKLTFDKGTGSTTPAYYTDGKAIRLYAGGTLKVSSGKTISKIVFEFGSGESSNAITANVGSYSNGTWTGCANEVVFTVAGTSGQRRFASVTVTYYDYNGDVNNDGKVDVTDVTTLVNIILGNQQ